MASEEIQTTNQGGVSKRPVVREGIGIPANPDSAFPMEGSRALRRRSNRRALVACVCGALALVLAVTPCLASGLLNPMAQIGWLRMFAISFFLAGWVGGLLGLTGCILGVEAVERRLDCPSRGGLPWALTGIVLGFLALLTAALAVLMSLYVLSGD